jgi:hypothetical protein
MINRRVWLLYLELAEFPLLVGEGGGVLHVPLRQHAIVVL